MVPLQQQPSQPSTSAWESFRALRNQNFRMYAAGQTVSLIGTWMQGVAQSWLVYRLSHSEFMLGLTLFATHVPVLLLGPVGGVAADHFSRKRIVLITQALAMLQALALAALTLTGAVTITHVILLAAFLGVVNAFDLPGRQTLFIQMVGKQDVISAISLNSAIFNLSRVAGPSLAGVVVAAFGESVCFLLNALSFIAMLASVARVTVTEPSSPFKGMKPGALMEGFRYAWKTRELKVLLALSGAMNIAYAPVLALGPFFADGMFQMGSAGLGFYGGAMGAGAVIGLLHLARHKGIAELPRIMLGSSVTMAAGLAMFAGAPWFSLSLLLMMVMGFGIMRQNASGNSLIQTVIPDDYRGRVTALYSMVVTGFLPLGSLAAGAAAEKFGPRAVVFAGAVICGVAALAFRRVMPQFNEWVKRQEEPCAAA
jgi:MFS family permease